MKCGKEIYISKAEAEIALKGTIEMARRSGHGGKSWKRLNIYYCKNCPAFHIGRANKKTAPKSKPEIKSIPSTGELRRKIRQLDKKLDRERRHRAYVIGKLVAADLLEQQLDNERRELQRQVTAMFLGPVQTR